MSETWLTMTASDLGRGIAKGDIDPVALTEVYLDAAQVQEITPRIYARMTEDRARAEAKAAATRAKNGLRASFLDGVPISWKDLFDTAGVATEAGSALLKDRVPTADAEVLRNATAAGLVCLGKTHMSELAFSGLGLNPITATPPCVNNTAAVAGGSSSGAATSVAFGIAAGAIGSDTGGSVRIPAAWNDLVGLKTTLGRLSVKGSVPLSSRFDTVGPLCRSVEDAAHLLSALEGSPSIDLTGARLEGARFAILRTAAFDDIRDAPQAAFKSAVERLQNAGAQVADLWIPEVDEALSLSAVLFSSEAYGQWADVIEANPDLMFPEILKRFRGGADVLAKDYIQAWFRLEDIRVEWIKQTSAFDAVILPTSPILPPDLDRLMSDPDFYVTENLLTLRNTRIGNLMGLSGLTLPTGVPSTGIMFLSAPFSEERLLRIGAAAEQALS
ncbi:amidase [Litoreibacter roseus]|uniref:Amidase n=1 Tax=Litoreibacter roseus TaxID=2601869 RepID=A0A6N6JM64_9RHOB|nr:amidase [Litoreibacter roseus]GFE66272.1 amidase [Litoreibacter roseus]